MAVLRNLTRGLRDLFRKESVEHELDEELREFLTIAWRRRDAPNESRAGRSYGKNGTGRMEAVKEKCAQQRGIVD